MTRKVNQAALAIIKEREGLHDGDPSTPELEPILCPAGIWTVGWGHALTHKGRQLAGSKDKALAMQVYRERWPAGMTLEDADALLEADTAKFAADVERLVTVQLNDNQFGALVSWHYNTGALASSTLLKVLNTGDYAGVPAQMLRWVFADGKRLRGLEIRRQKEAALFASAL